jgi:aminotransferase EvaB
MDIDHNYLPQQYSEEVLDAIRAVAKRGDFTLGAEVAVFEKAFAEMVGVKHAIGVANGTDALFLALKSLDVMRYSFSRRDEVITTPFSFYATSAAIANARGKPVFCDVGLDFNLDPSLIEEKITSHTVGILPVHWAGMPCDMDPILDIAKRHGLWVVEDSAHAPNSLYKGKRCGSFGDVNAFSLHPLKNVNVWGDGGVITTDSDEKAELIRKLRNHGMRDRDTCEFWGYNSRLDTVQAVVASHALTGLGERTSKRRKNAAKLDALLAGVEQIALPKAVVGAEPNYYLYAIHAERREELRAYLTANGVDAKVHYPTPLHLQPAAKYLGYERGAFPVAEWCADTTLSLPIHEFIREAQLERMAKLIRAFYA